MALYTERSPGRNPEPGSLHIDIDLRDRAVQLIARQFGLTLPHAALVADLANIGPREAR